MGGEVRAERPTPSDVRAAAQVFAYPPIGLSYEWTASRSRSLWTRMNGRRSRTSISTAPLAPHRSRRRLP